MNTEHTGLKLDHFTDHNSCSNHTLVPSEHQVSSQTSVNGDRINKTASTHFNSNSHGSINPSSITSSSSSSSSSRINVDELVTLSPEEIKMKWIQQDMYINHLEMQVKELKDRQDKMVPIKVLEDKLKSQSNEFKRRENLLVMKLAAKEHDHLNHFVSTNFLTCGFLTCGFFLPVIMWQSNHLNLIPFSIRRNNLKR